MKTSSFALILALGAVLAAGMTVPPAPSAEPAPDSGIRGKILVEGGESAAGAFVYAYDTSTNDMRVPAKLVSPPAAADGSYAMPLAPGSYYVVARKRASGSPRGYLSKGDFEGQYGANPVTVNPGEFNTVDLTVAMIPGRFLLAPYANVKGDMGICGTVTREDGKPYAGAYVMVYTRKDRIGRPALLAGPTGKDGRYAIYPTKPGTYYISARGDYGDLPKKGEPYGTYDKDPAHKVELKEKTILTDIDITLKAFTRDLTKCAEH